MHAITFIHHGITWKRITKTAARKRWAAGKEIALCACNLMPMSSWVYPFFLDPIDERYSVTTFENLVYEFEWYNCTLAETGTYASFYAPLKG